jgi:hypothetical protein
MNKKGFFISPVVILFFFIIGGMIAVYFSSADLMISEGITSDALIRKNNIQIWNEENAFASLFRTKTYYFSQTSSSTNVLADKLYSELNLTYIEFINDSYPFLKAVYNQPKLSSEGGIAVSSEKNITIVINYPFLEAVKLNDWYDEVEFCNHVENYAIGDWIVADISSLYVFFKNAKYNITEFYPFRVKRIHISCQ